MFTVLDDLLQTLFPSYCRGCRKAIATKTTLCLHCLSELPTTNFHLSNSNPLMKLLQQLIHQLKYMNGEQLGSLFGSLLGQKLVGSSFLSCDLVVPIPLHKRRQRQRG